MRILQKLSLASGLMLTVLAVGCGKKDAADSAPVSAPVQAETPSGTAPSAAPQTAVASGSASAEAVQAALNAKNYDQATTMMLNMHNTAQQLTPAQAAARAEQMRAFQQSLAAAAAAGDKSAIEAGRRLAQSRHR